MKDMRDYQMISNKNKSSIIGTLIAAIVILVLFVLGSAATPSWLTWAVTLPAWLIIGLTAAARLHDITELGKRWFLRRLGMILAASGALALIVAPMLGYSNSFPTWRGSCIYWGFALSWLTTPNMPPWWKYISGEYKLTKGQQA